jgi:hypothetical protein
VVWYGCSLTGRHTRRYDLWIHLLEEHQGDVPKKLPAHIYRAVYQCCRHNKNHAVSKIAEKYSEISERLAPMAYVEVRCEGSGVGGEMNQEQGGGHDEGVFEK